MDVGELSDLYRKAQAVRDDTVRQNLLQAIAETAGTAEALEKAKKDPAFAAGKGDAVASRLAELAETELEAAREASTQALGKRGKSVVPARQADAVAAEALAAEAIAAEALAAEATAAEAADARFSAEPLAVEAGILEGTAAEGTEAIGSSLRSFVDANTKRG